MRYYWPEGNFYAGLVPEEGDTHEVMLDATSSEWRGANPIICWGEGDPRNLLSMKMLGKARWDGSAWVDTPPGADMPEVNVPAPRQELPPFDGVWKWWDVADLVVVLDILRVGKGQQFEVVWGHDQDGPPSVAGGVLVNARDLTLLRRMVQRMLAKGVPRVWGAFSPGPMVSIIIGPEWVRFPELIIRTKQEN